MRTSIAQARGAVTFPAFAYERHYMIPFTQKSGLPTELKHWQPTVDAMLDGIKTSDEIYFMVDQKELRAGEPHRRPGVHVDGYWDKTLNMHGGHRPRLGCHAPQPIPGHRASIDGADDWANALFDAPEAIILASDITSALAYRGKWDGEVGHMGDCSNINIDHLNPILLSANTVFAGNAAMLHESIPVMFDCQRTVVRLNVPGWSPK